jgi:hypothetical protein
LEVFDEGTADSGEIPQKSHPAGNLSDQLENSLSFKIIQEF